MQFALIDNQEQCTPVKGLAELVVEELISGGMEKTSIRFLCALGTGSVSPHPLNGFGGRGKLISWGGVPAFLSNYGPGTKVAVISDGTIAYFPT